MTTKSDKNSQSLFTKTALLLVSTLTVMSGATISPSLPAMQDYFSEVNNAEFWVRLVLTIPALAIVIGSPIAGQIVDSIGRKPLLMASTALYGLGGASGFILDSLFAILAGRALLGLAVAGVMVSATTLIADYYQGDARANFMGLQAAFMGFGGVVFLSVGGYLADRNWRLPFLIYLFAWILLPLIIFSLYEPNRIEDGNESNTNSTLSAFPIKMLVLIYASVLLMQIVFYLIPVQLPFYLRSLTGASASQSGLAIAFATLFSALASMVYGKVKQRLSFIVILAFGLALMGGGNIIIGLAIDYPVILVGLVITGIGLGLLTPNLNVWLSKEIPDRLRGRALGGLTTFMFLGQFLSPIATQPLNNSYGSAATYGIAGVILAVLGFLFWSGQKRVCHFISSTAGRT